MERTPSSVRLATFCSSAMYSDCTELAMPRELTCTARVCATHTSKARRAPRFSSPEKRSEKRLGLGGETRGHERS